SVGSSYGPVRNMVAAMVCETGSFAAGDWRAVKDARRAAAQARLREVANWSGRRGTHSILGVSQKAEQRSSTDETPAKAKDVPPAAQEPMVWASVSVPHLARVV